MYNNTLSLFILTCQLPCVTAQYLLYSKMPVFLLPCPVGYALKRISELWLFALLPKWFVCTWSWKFCKCLLTLIHCEDRARKNLQDQDTAFSARIQCLKVSWSQQEIQHRRAIRTGWQEARALRRLSTIAPWAWQNVPVVHVYGFSNY